MGDEIYMYLKINGSSLISKVGPYVTADSGDKVKVVIDIRKVHFFDPKTKKAIV